MYFDWRLWAMTLGVRGRVATGVVLGLASLCAGIARFVFLGRLLVLVFESAPLSALLPPAIGVAAAIILRSVLEEWRTKLAHRTAARVQEQLRLKLFDKLIALGPGWLSVNRTGGVMLSIVDGVEQLQSFFGQYLPQLFVSICAPIAIFAVVAWWDLPVAAVMVLAAIAALLLPSTVHRQNQDAARARQRAMKAFGEEFLDAIQGLPTLKAFGQSQSYARMLAVKARELSANTMWVLMASIMTRGITDIAIALGAACALALGIYRVTQGMMSLEALLIVLMAGTEIFRPLRDLRTVLHQGMVGQSAAQGIHALLDEPETQPAGGRIAASTWQDSLSVAFDGVTFAYPGSRGEVLKGLSFEVPAGSRVGIVGPSGAGKSSLVKLLLRLYDPQGGVVRIGGIDIKAVGPETVREHIAVVNQDTYLFHGSVEENLRLGRANASRQEIEDAARTANAHEFILALPDGYDTLIGERGTKLSGGQRQRMAIARALLLDAPILILDEALSSVDAENESIIQEALDRVMRGRTTLILAHRLSSVIGADRIFVLEAGRVAQAGTHADLIAADGPYRRLMAAQAGQTLVVDSELAQTPRPSESALMVSGPRSDAGGGQTGQEAKDISADARELSWGVTLRSLLSYIRPWRGQLILTTCAGLGRVVAYIAVGVLGALAIAALKAGEDATGFIFALLVVAPMAGILHWLESWLAHDMAYQLLAEMRIAFFAKLEALAPAYLLERRTGDLVALATHDIETVEYFYAHTVAPALVAGAIPIAVLVWLGVASSPLALVLIPFLGYAALSPFLRRTRVDREGSRARAALGQLSAFVAETIQGMTELVAFRALPDRRAQFAALVRDYQRVRITLLEDLARQTELLELATGFGGLAIALVGAYLASHGAIAASALPLFILIAVAAFLPVSEIAQVSRQLADTIASTRRLYIVESATPSVEDGALEQLDDRAPLAAQFADVRFCYPERNTAALTDVTFDVRRGGTLALVGPSGAGKTTIANLLLRFWDPQAGRVCVLGAGATDLKLERMRDRIAVVTQDTYLFNDTLEANVRLARPDASAEALRGALSRAALGEFIDTLPEGLQTRVGERGMQLSGGQRQRVAIARAFLKDAPILVLDEATSHLDAISEAQVREALGLLMRDRTTIVIAHRLSTVRSADRILVLEQGRVSEAGTDAELIARRGAYFRLVERQLGAVGRADTAGRVATA